MAAALAAPRDRRTSFPQAHLVGSALATRAASETAVNTVNLTAAALVTQLLLLVILAIGIGMFPRDRFWDYPEEINLWPWFGVLSLLTLGPLILCEDMTNLSKAIFGQANLGIFAHGFAKLLMFLGNVLLLTVLIAKTGGARFSPFAAAMLVLPTLAIVLRESYGRVILYVVLVSLSLFVTSPFSPRGKSADPEATWASMMFVTIFCMLLSAFVSYVTAPRYWSAKRFDGLLRGKNVPDATWRNAMNAATRACVAYVAGRVISKSDATNVYDYSRSKHVLFSGDIDGDDVRAYDHDRSCHFGGSIPNLYDYGRRVHVQLNIDGTEFRGYDYGDQHHFSGKVNGQQIQLYDYGESKHFNYSV